ncbi:type II toxin-antitoxin system RelE/ParE family toxin [Allorhizobium sp. NPDC080224]|uniref:type II toxin-antitoxin system RelE/ParE family toxin n=1 Tax=Rhizobium/Agrobacterium group TaxID=227290 RepID=UPI0005915D75|nr:type II toxin-antitoxin system RelE/ParE family toxin [Agrobacterium albertimagni]
MKLRFTRDAVRDLEDLRDWLRPRSPSGHKHVVTAIRTTLRRVQEQPQSGRLTERPDIREAVEPRFGFILPYTVRGDILWVLRVYNARRHPMIWTDDDAI